MEALKPVLTSLKKLTGEVYDKVVTRQSCQYYNGENMIITSSYLKVAQPVVFLLV